MKVKDFGKDDNEQSGEVSKNSKANQIFQAFKAEPESEIKKRN